MSTVNRALTDPDEYRWCRVKFLEREVLADNEEPSRFLQHWTGRIEWADPENEQDRATLGAFSLYLADLVGAATENVSAYDVFDTTQSSWEVFETLFSPKNYQLRGPVKRLAFGDEYPLTEGVLILERVTVLPQHRGHSVGLLAITTIIEQFRAAAGIVVLKAFPLQFEVPPSTEAERARYSELGLDCFTRSARTAFAKLRNHYARLGFVSVPRTEYMVLDPSRRLPEYEALVAAPPPSPVKQMSRKPNLGVSLSGNA